MSDSDAAPEFFVVDGDSHTPHDFGDDDALAVPFVAVTPDGLAQKTVFGFTTKQGLESFLVAAGYARDFHAVETLLQRAAAAVAAESYDEDTVRTLQSLEAADAIPRYYRSLGRHGASSEQVANLIADYNPLLGAPVHSALLFRLPKYHGVPCPLGGG